jgi:hypothetical protein
LFLSDTARAWLKHLPPGQISNWDDLVQAFASNFQGTYVHHGNSWDLRSCRQQPGESLRDYIQRFSKQRTELPNVTDSDVIGAFLAGTTYRDLVSKLGRKTPTRASELMDIATKFASGQQAVEAIFRKDKQPRAASRKMSPRRPLSVAPRRKARISRKRNATPPTRTLSPPLSTRTLGNLPEEPISSTRCSRSRAPIIRGPSSTPLRSASCFGTTFTRPGHLRKVARPTTTTRRRITFDQGDHPDRVPSPGKYPLVVDPVIGNVRLTKVLMDGGNSLNIIYAETLGLLRIDLSSVRAGAAPFHGIIPGKRVHPSDNSIYSSALGLPPTSEGKPSRSRWSGSEEPTTQC